VNGSRTSARFAYWGSYMICMHSFALVFVARRIFKRGYGSSVFRIDAMHLSRPRYTYVAGSLQILLLTQSTYVQDREDGIVIEMGFAIFILFKDLIDFNPELRERIEPDEMEAMTDAGTSITYAMAWSFFADKTKSVEIARDGFLERFYFPIPPVCTYLSRQTQDTMKWSIDRSSPANKVQAFME
jgi:hypothetical protein